MRAWIGLLIAGLTTACAAGANVAQERDALMQRDKDWATAAKDVDTFMSYYTTDASMYAPDMPKLAGTKAIRDAYSTMVTAPDFSLKFTPARVEVATSGDVGYTTGTYQMTMNGVADKGKYVTVWKKADGTWKVAEDIFNSDGRAAPKATHTIVAADSITFGDPPPSLPPGAKLAVISGDPSKPEPYVMRVQVPAGYRVAPHWHPADENLTVLSGTVALGMGDAWDDSKLRNAASGALVVMPADMRHYFLARNAATFQVHGMGPFTVNYVNPSDDPSRKQ